MQRSKIGMAMTDSIPASIGNFRILSKLGQGGMGSVFRAVHGTLERPCALKVLPPEFSSHEEYVSRFLREARTIAAITHQNIIQVYDSGEFSGQYYIAMELVEGGNLLNVADARTKIDEAQGIELMLQAARGLSAAHAKGLIHRDIKPENLLLGTDGVLRIVDFGLVMDSDSATQLTLAGTCLGTPMYMSPEQADGETADPRSDLYSLGATFYRVITGRPLFGPGKTLSILFKQKFEKPTDPQSIRPELSRGISDVLLHLLAKRREDRPNDAQALIAMLEDLKAGKAIPPPPEFAPLIPKQKAEIAEPSVSVDGETAVLFGSGQRRRVSDSPRTESRSPVIVAAILFVMCAAVLFAIASNRKQTTAAFKPAVSVENERPPISEAEVRERIGMGDAAFDAGRIKDARAIYLETLKLAPGNSELIRRRDVADRRIRHDLEMQAGSELEQSGKLTDALTRYNNAVALVDEDTEQGKAARAAVDRVNAAIERAKEPAVVFSPASPRDEKAEELANVEAQAESFLKQKEYEKAEAAYVRAQEFAGDSKKATLAERAKQCRRMAFLAQARAAENANDLARAETGYVKAQELSNDAETAAALDAVRQKMHQQDLADARFRDAMRDGQASLEKGNFADARVKFGVAHGVKPDDASPSAKLGEVDARELLLKGDAARDAGDLVEARKIYEQAIVKSAAAEADARERMKGLDKIPSRAMRAIARARELAGERKDETALDVLYKALQLDPASAALKETKDALNAARQAEDIYDQLQKLEASALDTVKTAAAAEDDETTKRFRAQLTKLQTASAEKTKKPLEIFASSDNAAAQGALATARGDVADLETELMKAAEHYSKTAEKLDEKAGIKVPFLPKIGMGGDRKKSEKYRGVAEAFKQLAGQTKALSAAPHK